MWCVLARRAARPCHIAWSHRLSAGVKLSLARASVLEATSLRRCMLCVFWPAEWLDDVTSHGPIVCPQARAATLEATSLRRCMLCVLARRVARRCHIAWSHRLSAGVKLSLARASILEAPCSSEGGHEPRHVLANPAISMSANVYLGLRKTLQFCPPTNINQKPAPDCTSQVQVEVDVCCGRYCSACNTLCHWKPLPPCRGTRGVQLNDLSTRML